VTRFVLVDAVLLVLGAVYVTWVSRPRRADDVDRADLVEVAATARRLRDWGPLADRLVRLRAWGVSVAALSVVVGVGESRLRRMVCRDHGPDPAAVGDLLADTGWVDTAPSARAVLGVSVARLLEHTVGAEVGRGRGDGRVDPAVARPVAAGVVDGVAGRPPSAGAGAARSLRGPGPGVGRGRCDRRGGRRRGWCGEVERLPVRAGRAGGGVTGL